MKDTLRPGIEHEFRFRISTSKTVPALYPESKEFQAIPEVLATGYMAKFDAKMKEKIKNKGGTMEPKQSEHQKELLEAWNAYFGT